MRLLIRLAARVSGVDRVSRARFGEQRGSFHQHRVLTRAHDMPGAVILRGFFRLFFREAGVEPYPHACLEEVPRASAATIDDARQRQFMA